MSEELLQTIPQQVGKYTYYRLGSTTLNQLRAAGLIPKKAYDALSANKPDGLVTYHGQVKAVVEYKQPKHLSSPSDIEKAINQELAVAKALCKILIVTDSTKTFWINSKNGQKVTDSDGAPVQAIFHPAAVNDTATLEYLLDEIDASLTKTNSAIKSAKLIDPTPLAARLWQTIWVATGKSPVKCLYNVVELFIFKFLSDLNVLPDDIDFNRIYKKSRDSAEEALDFYARNTRPRIVKLFPQGKDGTTIINGTIFVNEDGAANLSQSILFKRSIEHLHGYSEEFGSLTKIDKQFKTKLYESFLKQEVEALGQHFTPRKIVQSVIRMSGVALPTYQFTGKRICDPFCGVGGFPLEVLNMNEGMRNSYKPNSKGKINVPFVLNGYDKGFERDDERTIILAKANMLIYLAEILFRNPNCTEEFARVFNESFTLFKDNLGTFGHIISDEAEKFDLILSNPPYVTSGSGIIKEEIRNTPRTQKAYPINALGLEGLSLEWIINSLKPGGQAYLIIPDGLLGRVGGKKLRNFILQQCYLDAIVSLPVRTFFANWENTYIFVISKKHDIKITQTNPVFTYLVSNIGERLTSVKREQIADDDLPEMESLFRIFVGAPSVTKKILEDQSKRCKIQSFEKVRDAPHWVIDRWWTRAERVALGIDASNLHAKKDEVETAITSLTSAVSQYEKFLEEAEKVVVETVDVSIGDKSLFHIFIGERLIVKDISQDEKLVPAFSANVMKPMGYIAKSNVEHLDRPTILWGIDGNFEFRLVKAGTVFATTDHCGAIQILNDQILPEYLLFALNKRKLEESFDRSFRASLTNMRMFSISIPVSTDGNFDLEAQKSLAARFVGAREKQDEMNKLKTKFDGIFKRYINSETL